MGLHHEAFQALGPVDWASVPQDNLKQFMADVFAEAQIVVESIPDSGMSAATKDASSAGRARAKTDSAVVYSHLDFGANPPPQGAAASQESVQRLRKEWKEAKVNPRDNPLDISVYKLASKDGKGAWFARRSVHEGLSFDMWKTGLEREFAETMKVQGSPGSGSIRGIGADKNVENRTVDGAGHLNVFQLSAQFPGPTSPRDFITLLLTSDSAQSHQPTASSFRQYTVVSKPCTHPECPPRQGIIRGQYESVEIIREIPSENSATKRSYSSADLTSSPAKSPKLPGGHGEEGAPGSSGPQTKAIEWLMVTRSDPGGSVPRFMIEKGTPPGIVGDASKFLKWATAMAANNFEPADEAKNDRPVVEGDRQTGNAEIPSLNLPQGSTQAGNDTSHQESRGDESVFSSNGLYGIISGAFGAATYVASGLRNQFSSYGSQGSFSDDAGNADPEDEDTSSDSDTSSMRSFASALEKRLTAERAAAGSNVDDIGDADSGTASKLAHDKELQKLSERRRKADENFAKMQERLESKRSGDKEKDAASLSKLREKHEKELAKQQAKYQREVQKLEQKRQHEERKAVARRRKTIEREEKSNLSLELERTRAEKDLALKQIEILQKQVGDLQAQNTMLVAKYGKMGGGGALDRSASFSSKESKGSSRMGSKAT